MKIYSLSRSDPSRTLCQRKQRGNRSSVLRDCREVSSVVKQMKGIVAQMAVVSPTIAAGTKGTSVTLNLNAGDSVPKGSVPSVNCDGWAEIADLGLTKSTNSDLCKWVRFHLLNEHAGGPGDDFGNLTSATALANHARTWSDFETKVKNAILDNEEPAPAAVNFSVQVGYPASVTTIWKKVGLHAGRQITTDAQNYPNSVTGTLTVGAEDPTGVTLGIANGLYGPEHFKRISNFKRVDVMGADEYPGARNWETV